MTTRTAVTIVMYHVVRPSAGIASTLIGLDQDEFRAQLTYIRAHYTPIDLFALADAAATLADLPPNPVVLTFDDGYAVHHDLVLPVLGELRMPASFFPVASAMIERDLLDVNKIQLMLARRDRLGAVIDAIDREIDDEAIEGGAPRADYRAKWWTPSRWDSAEVVYVKRLLQFALPEAIRRPLLDELFRRFVSSDERALAEELYMSADDVRELRRAGMTIGAHGDKHLRLSTLTRVGQEAEIDGALRVLDAVDVPRNGFAYCYANGDYNDDSLELLRARRCRLALTTRPERASIETVNLLTLPRVDTNDLPKRLDANPGESNDS